MLNNNTLMQQKAWLVRLIYKGLKRIGHEF